MAKKKATPAEKSGKMTLEDAKKVAEKYLPKKEDDRFDTVIGSEGKEIKRDKFDVMYVTSDGNVFYKKNEGSARSHARKNKYDLFEVKF